MSLPFNDTTNLKGIIQEIEKECGMNEGDISDHATKLKEWTASVNLALDDYFSYALPASGKWQLDDSGHTKYPIIKTDINSGQRDYAFTTDEQSNLILDIYKVAILTSATATLYEELKPVDTQSEDGSVSDFNNSSHTGTPTEYDKTANGIIFREVPDYTATNGLLIYINREASYFTSSDTTKKPGVPGIHHRYFAIKPALDFARRNNLTNYNRLREEVISFEGDEEKGIHGSIEKYFGRREKDVRKRLTMVPINYF